MSLDQLVGAGDFQKQPVNQQVVGSVRQFLADAGNAVNQLRTEPTLPTEERLAEILVHLELPQNVRESLVPRFSASGFTLEPAPRPARHPYGNREHFYTPLFGGAAEVALVHIPSIVFYSPKKTFPPFLQHLVLLLKAFRGKSTRLCAESIGGLTHYFNEAFNDERRTEDWQFILWPDLESVQEGSLDAGQVFQLSGAVRAGMAARKDVDPLKLSQALGRVAEGLDGSNVPGQFRVWVELTQWPDEWKDARRTGWSGNAINDARALVDFAISKVTFPKEHAFAGRNVLGDLLAKILATSVAGGVDADIIARTIIDCQLLADSAELKTLRDKYVK